jgi:hypothetical protein
MATAKRAKTLPLTHLDDKPHIRNYNAEPSAGKRLVAGGKDKHARAAKMHKKSKAS